MSRMPWLGLIAMVSVSLAAACGTTASSTQTGASFPCAGQTFAYASFGSQVPFFASVDKGIKDTAAKDGVNLLYYDNAFDAQKALANANLIAARPDVVAVIEDNYFQKEDLTLAGIFKAAHLPVLGMDTPVADYPYYGGNDYQAGLLAGQGLVAGAKAKFSGSVDLLIVEKQSASGQPALELRAQGIIDGAKAAMPSLSASNIVTFEDDGTVAGANTAITATLTAHPDGKHVLIGMLGDSNGVAAANAAVSAGRGDQVLASGMGGDQVGLGALRGAASPFYGTSDWRTNNYGNDVIPLACDLAKGKPIPPKTFINHIFLTRANINQYHPLTTP